MAKKKQSVQTNRESRSPVITILGHVDHGKTSILDFIRSTNITAKEFGGITQHIGAYQIESPEKILKSHPEYSKKITFIDTPGHLAFAKMRSHGAKVADIAILVVAANDGVKPQTIESINHIKEAKINSVVAINKIDLPDVNVEKVKKQLHKEGLTLEEYGGEIPVVEVSAKTGAGIDKLLETVLFLTDLFQTKESKNDKFAGVVIESTLSKFKGLNASIIVRSGKLSVGDEVVSENQEFKIRAIIDWKNKQMPAISAGDPGEILGWKNIPAIGSVLYKKSESQIEIAPTNTIVKAHSAPLAFPNPNTDLEISKIKFILKADTLGTLNAIADGIPKDVDIINKAVGNITESDVLLAKTAKALIIGFNQKPSDQVSKLANSEKVLIKTYNIIYELFDEIVDLIEAIKKGDLVTVLGEAKVLAIFNIKNETIVGAKVLKGRIAKGDQVKVLRNDQEIIRTKIKTLRHLKTEITKAETGQEIGIGLMQKAEILTGDSIISIG